MYDGYFVHYFAPRGLPVVPKDVIFVIDVSGSMIGTKIKQVKWMKRIKINMCDLVVLFSGGLLFCSKSNPHLSVSKSNYFCQ